MQGAARQGGIAAQGHGKVAAKVDRNALRSKSQYTFGTRSPRDRPREHGARIGPDERN